MTWLAFHHRADILRAVTDEADRRRDGALPADVPGVSATFRDDLDLLRALQLRWYTRLSGALERSLASQPRDLDAAVRDGWVRTAEAMPGIRWSSMPTSRPRAIPRWLAPWSGRWRRSRCCSRPWPAAPAARSWTPIRAPSRPGRLLREEARATYAAVATSHETAASPAPARTHRAEPRGSAAFVERIKDALAA